MMLSLLSFLSPSYIIVPIRELANILHSFASNNQLELFQYYSINIEIDMHREHSASFSLNNSRRTSVNSAVSSIDYID